MIGLIPLVKFSHTLLSLSSSAPCAPSAPNVTLQKIEQSYWVMTSWDSVNCSEEYFVELTGKIQNDPQALMEVSFNGVQMEYFESPMPCSTAYNLTVRSKNSAGVSEPSTAFTGVTGNFNLHLSLTL